MSDILDEYHVVKEISRLGMHDHEKAAEIMKTVSALITACCKSISYFEECVESHEDESAEEWVHLQRALLLSKGIDLPIRAALLCPECKAEHVDAPEPENGWTNPPHKKHLCHECGHLWTPYPFPTYGVASTETCAYCQKPYEPVGAEAWRVNDKPTCWDCYVQFCENAQADREVEHRSGTVEELSNLKGVEGF